MLLRLAIGANTDHTKPLEFIHFYCLLMRSIRSVFREVLDGLALAQVASYTRAVF